ncbi:hypothetical protein [Asticcacaulis tiandongensis]|uniref:hypothetical protein n=1 Tax=Asticcacaulis tiandongensis TaxID=2565365 RepID=UPI00112D0C06|nr:hypothetical protein [Asticcacaulis tiandongensis]
MRLGLIAVGLMGLWPVMASAGESFPITGSWLKTADAPEVAARLLPEDALDVVDIRVGNTIVFAHDPPANVRLYARPESATALVCRRVSYHVAFQPEAGADPQRLSDETVLHVNRVSSSGMVGLSKGEVCADLPVNRFASVQGRRTEAEAIEVLEWLSGLQSLKKPPKELTVTCQAKIMPEVCNGSPFKVLTSLPLEKTYIIDGNSIAVMPNGAGQLYWDVRIETEGEKRRISLVWKIPAPF